MTNLLRLALGALTIAPLVLTLVGLVRLLTWFADLVERGGAVGRDELQAFLGESVWFWGGAAVLLIVLLFVYLAHLLVVRAADETGQRVLWLVLLVAAGIFTMPIYWYLHLWSARGPDLTGRSGAVRPPRAEPR